MKKRINFIIKSYLSGKWSYSKFSYEISPLLWDAVDGSVEDEEIKKWLIGIMELLTDFLDDEFFVESDFKKSLESMLCQ